MISYAIVSWRELHGSHFGAAASRRGRCIFGRLEKSCKSRISFMSLSSRFGIPLLPDFMYRRLRFRDGEEDEEELENSDEEVRPRRCFFCFFLCLIL